MELERTRIECDTSRITIWISNNAPVTSPQLNLSGVLIGLNAVFFGYDYSVKIIAMLGQEVHLRFEGKVNCHLSLRIYSISLIYFNVFINFIKNR